jgi:hypothetical protein
VSRETIEKALAVRAIGAAHRRMEQQVYGLEVEGLPNTRRDLIGEINDTASGNIYLRVGRENEPSPDAATGWHQVAHVVLTPIEVEAFARTLLASIGKS